MSTAATARVPRPNVPPPRLPPPEDKDDVVHFEREIDEEHHVRLTRKSKRSPPPPREVIRVDEEEEEEEEYNYDSPPCTPPPPPKRNRLSDSAIVRKLQAENNQLRNENADLRLQLDNIQCTVKRMVQLGEMINSDIQEQSLAAFISERS